MTRYSTPTPTANTVADLVAMAEKYATTGYREYTWKLDTTYDWTTRTKSYALEMTGEHRHSSINLGAELGDQLAGIWKTTTDRYNSTRFVGQRTLESIVKLLDKSATGALKDAIAAALAEQELTKAIRARNQARYAIGEAAAALLKAVATYGAALPDLPSAIVDLAALKDAIEPTPAELRRAAELAAVEQAKVQATTSYEDVMSAILKDAGL